MLRDNLPQRPALVYGRKYDKWERENWQDLRAEHDVVVCTPEILHKCLHRGYIAIEDINLLVLDEPHHAKKGHP